jgi:hypothetical protein
MPYLGGTTFDLQQQQQQQVRPPASVLLLASHQEAAAAAPAGHGAAVVAPPTAWIGSRPAAAAAGSSNPAVMQPGGDVIVTLQLFESGLDGRRQVMQQLQVGSTTSLCVCVNLSFTWVFKSWSISQGSYCACIVLQSQYLLPARICICLCLLYSEWF